MRICIVVPYFTSYVHGNEYGLAKGLCELGHSVTIVTSTAKAPREKKIANSRTRSVSNYEFDVNYLPVLFDMGDNPIITGIDKHIKNFDVVLLQEDYPFICHKAYSSAKKCGIPAILSSERTYYPENIAKRYVLKALDATTNKKLRDSVNALTATAMLPENL